MSWEEEEERERERKKKGGKKGGFVGRDWKRVPESTSGDTCSKLDSNSTPLSFRTLGSRENQREACVRCFFVLFVLFSFCFLKIKQKQINSGAANCTQAKRIDFPV